jgi:hypothetical protein
MALPQLVLQLVGTHRDRAGRGEGLDQAGLGGDRDAGVVDPGDRVDRAFGDLRQDLVQLDRRLKVRREVGHHRNQVSIWWRHGSFRGQAGLAAWRWDSLPPTRSPANP